MTTTAILALCVLGVAFWTGAFAAYCNVHRQRIARQREELRQRMAPYTARCRP